MDKLLTIAEMAKELDIAESTVRYYRDRFPDFMFSVGEGRKKRYRPETVEVLRFIAEGFNRNLTAIEIESGLSLDFSRNIEVEEETAEPIAVAQQQSKNELNQYAVQLQTAMEQMGSAMQIMVDQKEEIAELRKQVAEQKQYVEETLQQRDERLMESMKQFLEQKKATAASSDSEKKGFWARIFNR
ncbi:MULTISPECIES: MerR family transcriptional regulator [Bacillales]|uniref:MerR family transcriptional regulator n=1 Tax=Fictibacillus terranigra TaxID=3058424 RepID=A0ABT8EEC7_9BACL|nr:MULTISPECIES: MerR family transcriptional regulator [Bacillales]MDN4076291.1 MerR family transcriptional regulator [Fictibacillus sp. CENA-BCM004]MDN4086230.1 MerR family transcriptional regulator [Paenibacillus polymyxa]